MSIVFSHAVNSMNTEEIDDILKLTQRPDIISFAGGLPAAEVFPVEEVAHATEVMLKESSVQALQYSSTQGFPKLREQIAARLNEKFCTKLTADNLLITSGSQQALDFAARIFINPGDVILCESPTYMAALSAFSPYAPTIIGVPTDEQGMIPEELEKILTATQNVKFIYVIPDFQNPTGRTWSVERRHALVDLSAKYNIPIVEDNPYGELRFEGTLPPSLKSLDKAGLVIFVGTFSKIFCPGMRIAWVAADPAIIAKFATVKQAADLHSSSFCQLQVAKYLELYDIEKHIKKIIALYGSRRDIMLKTMAETFPQNVTFTRPEGGLFTWVTLPKQMDSKDLLQDCLENKVAFVPGHIFFPDQNERNHFRLNYSGMPPEKIKEGIERLASIIKKHNK
ncbi:MAG: PLP-dependent aminotransferase family protein [Sporomusaceae bacterium]|nr:PLP-dependent aminotransferase family protein [Sporomusaceae bacterium]